MKKVSIILRAAWFCGLPYACDLTPKASDMEYNSIRLEAMRDGINDYELLIEKRGLSGRIGARGSEGFRFVG
jgi:hypothetical protein